MSSLAEVSANTVYFLTRTAGEIVGERLMPPIPLQVEPRVGMEQAAQNTTFEARAQAFYSASYNEKDPELKAEALFISIENIINKGRFRQARVLLESEVEMRLDELPRGQRPYFQARREEKYGWIADYEGGYQDSHDHFVAVRKNLGQVKDQEAQKVQDLFSTSTHFLGRAFFGLASQGIDRANNTERAIDFFEEDLASFVHQRENGNPKPANEGFQHAWLASCYMLSRNLGLADEHLNQARHLFTETLSIDPNSGVMAHYHLVQGLRDLNLGFTLAALEQFTSALKISDRVEYPLGYARAAGGIALVQVKEGNLLEAARYTSRAIKAYPLLVVGILNGSFP